MRVICVARHPFLADHIGRCFEGLGIDTVPCVGVSEAMDLVSVHNADAVLCDYDLLAAIPVERWSELSLLDKMPIVAVSLTRNSSEAHLLDTGCLAGFLYLPTLDAEEAHRTFAAVRRKRRPTAPPDVHPWTEPASVAQLR